MPVAKLLRDTSRANDLVAQIAPVVFSVWLCEVSEPGALTRAERLIAAASRLPYDDMPQLTIGVAVFDPASDETIDDLMDRAGDAAFVARRLGAGRAQLAETTAEIREALSAFA
jgi:GGDEF domain-containing protein